MNIEKTLVIIKPDSIKKNIIGEIIKTFENNNLQVISAKITKKNKAFFEKFYIEHKNKAFFNELLEFMTSSHIMVLILEGMNAIKKTREIIGDTNYKVAKDNTIRKKFAKSLTENAIHGSDSINSSNREIKLFFNDNEIFSNKKK